MVRVYLGTNEDAVARTAVQLSKVEVKGAGAYFSDGVRDIAAGLTPPGNEVRETVEQSKPFDGRV